MIEFEWDARKAAANVRKHGVAFEEAATVFGDRLAVTFADPGHTGAEERFLTFGMSRGRRLLVVAHPDREGRVRVISARPLTGREREIYEEG